LRNIKLRFSRKLIFIAGLLACFSFELDPPQNADAIRADRENLPSVLANHVLGRLAMPPLDALGTVLLAHGDDATAKMLFDAYDEFLGILLDRDKRTELSQLPIEDALASKVWIRARDASHGFRDGLEELFLKKQGLLSELTLRFGVF
jgi:hypothetical protein